MTTVPAFGFDSHEFESLASSFSFCQSSFLGFWQQDDNKKLNQIEREEYSFHSFFGTLDIYMSIGPNAQIAKSW